MFIETINDIMRPLDELKRKTPHLFGILCAKLVLPLLKMFSPTVPFYSFPIQIKNPHLILMLPKNSRSGVLTWERTTIVKDQKIISLH